MNVFYEEDGGFKVARVMEDTVTSLQIEAISGKRSKIKANAVVLRFESALDAFLANADTLAADIDADFLWQVCGESEFGCEALAEDYTGHKPTPPEIAAVAIKLHASPMYFYKRGKGRYQAAPEANLKAALASIARKEREAEQMASWVAALARAEMPDEMRAHQNTLLYKPDRNTLMVKACEAAVAQTQTPLAQLFFAAGAWPEHATTPHGAPHVYHVGKFLAENFPKGRDYAGVVDVITPTGLPATELTAFSIDDAATTEIDDAFSVRHLADGQVEIGIHIAAPTLFFGADSALEKLAADRLSTVYFPGDKITMLPAAAVAAATLAEGQRTPVVSLYALFSSAVGELVSTRSVIETVMIARNLRIGELETRFHADAIASGAIAGEFGAELLVLYAIAQTLGKRRGKKDGDQDKVDYNFEIRNARVDIIVRKRGNPIDTVVSELMIFANSEWGKWLADNGVAAIYRAQSNMKTRMTTDALPHEGLGVAQYAWSSSPLRRYVDLVNQRQLVAALRGEVPPYIKRNRESMNALNDAARRFDLTYETYADYQRNLERFWCLRYLEQEGIATCTGSIIRDELVRLDNLPLVVKLDKNPALPGKTRVQIARGEIRYWDISADFTLIAPDVAPDISLAAD